MKRDELEALTVKELRLIAAEKGVPKATKLTKPELITALSAAAKSKAKRSKGTATSTRTQRRSSFTAPAPARRKSATKLPPGAPPAAKSSSSLLAPVMKAPGPAPIVGSNPGLPVPEHYGNDRLVLMVQDPHHVFAYWELQPETVARVSHAAQGASTPVLAIHTGGSTEFREVDLRGGNYYLAVGPDQDYEAELALRDRHGKLHTLARSNKVHTPTPTISSRVDEQWMGVDETFHELLELAGLPSHLRGAAGSVARLADQRRLAWSWQHSGVTSLSSSVLSSHSLSSTSRLSKS
jgi:uncharacterized protein